VIDKLVLCVYNIEYYIHGLMRRAERKGEKHMEYYSLDDDRALVEQIYTGGREANRLNRTQAKQVEFFTNIRIIEQYLKPGAAILDVGAGGGAYSLYFAQKGYKVSALELSQDNIEAFRENMTEQDSIDLVQGNAVDLSRYKDSSFDIILLFGPLYHLHNEEDRQKCIAEAIRVCKPDGVLFFAFISNDMVIVTEFMRNQTYLSNGAYDKDTFKLTDFPFVFFTVERCRSMLDTAGIKIIREVASDGITELIEDKVNTLSQEDFAQYLRYHFYICEKPEFLGTSNHLLFVGKK